MFTMAFLHSANEQNKVRNKRIDQIEAEILVLKGQPAGVHYEGIYEQGKTFPQGSLCTKAGSLWLALTDTIVPPGSNPNQWRLVVKKGDA